MFFSFSFFLFFLGGRCMLPLPIRIRNRYCFGTHIGGGRQPGPMGCPKHTWATEVCSSRPVHGPSRASEPSFSSWTTVKGTSCFLADALIFSDLALVAFFLFPVFFLPSDLFYFFFLKKDRLLSFFSKKRSFSFRLWIR
jgi:hypothetical protein